MSVFHFLYQRVKNWRKPCKLKHKVDVEALLPDAVKQELQAVASHLKSERVSVRDLNKGEIPSDIPEIGAQPFSAQLDDTKAIK